MPVRVKIDLATVTRAVQSKLLPALARRTVEDIQQEAKKNFQNRTGNLYASIRTEGSIAAIGSAKIHYWRFVKDFTRGPGIIWIRRAANRDLEGRLSRAAKDAGLL